MPDYFYRFTEIFQVKQKVEDIRGMLVGTKTKVDHLMPKSEELLTQSQRQERAISNIHSDLTEKTNAIIQELSQVRRVVIQQVQRFYPLYFILL